MALNQFEIDEYLNKFYTLFPYTKLTVLDDSLVYSVPFGYANTIRIEAQNLIDSLKLPLIAKTFSRNNIFSDVVLIEIKED